MNSITIKGLTHRQVAICEMLWKLQDWDDINRLCRAGGPEFYAMLYLMAAEQLDQVDSVALAQQALKPYRLTGL